ncbi:hypothetical protein [Aeromicrobium sp.]|uniref:hypothetical protein n=1 Tax=Aeromicrobium sp. TaxID=1871063 RepID=UPI0028B22BDB|nr:hypothetical protein [Aeromicrobium sp.]
MRAIVAMLTAVLLSTFAVGSASATEDVSERSCTAAEYGQLFAALDKAGATSTGVGGLDPRKTVSVDEKAWGDIQKLSAGGGFTNPYISFNRTDQQALLNGSVAGIVGTICVVGTPVACAVAGAIAAVALVYLNKHGLCPSSKKNLRVYVHSRTAKCVK